MNDLRLAVLALIAVGSMTECGAQPSAGRNLVGFWTPGAGTGLVVYLTDDNQVGWSPQRLLLRRLGAFFSTACWNYATTSSGDVTFPGSRATDPGGGRVSEAADGGFELAFSVPDAIVDSEYRQAPGFDAGAAVGAVTGAFSGHATELSGDLLRIDWEMAYSDSEKFLEKDEGSFEVGRSESCR